MPSNKSKKAMMGKGSSGKGNRSKKNKGKVENTPNTKESLIPACQVKPKEEAFQDHEEDLKCEDSNGQEPGGSSVKADELLNGEDVKRENDVDVGREMNEEKSQAMSEADNVIKEETIITLKESKEESMELKFAPAMSYIGAFLKKKDQTVGGNQEEEPKRANSPLNFDRLNGKRPEYSSANRSPRGRETRIDFSKPVPSCAIVKKLSEVKLTNSTITDHRDQREDREAFFMPDFSKPPPVFGSSLQLYHEVNLSHDELPETRENALRTSTPEIPDSGHGTLDLSDSCLYDRKHPLKNAWTLWYNANNPSISWEENLRPVYTVSTIEDFWALIHYTETAELLQCGTDYGFFKEGIKPMWEDEKNSNGGRWYVSLVKRSHDILDGRWLNILLLLIGATLPDVQEECINGVVLNIKPKADRISLWMNVADTKRFNTFIRNIGIEFKKSLGLRHEKVYFEAHNSLQKKQSSMGKPDLAL